MADQATTTTQPPAEQQPAMEQGEDFVVVPTATDPSTQEETTTPMTDTPRGKPDDEHKAAFEEVVVVETPVEAPAAASSSSAASAAAAAASSSSATAAPAAAAPPLLNAIEPSLLVALDDLLFGPPSNCNDNDRTRWRQQGFVFSTQASTLFGLTQTAGGPCGVLAPVQAWILQRLLFGGVVAATSVNGAVPVSPTTAEQDEALVWALTTAITRCTAATKKEGFVIVSGGSHDTLQLHQLATPDEVRSFFTQQLALLHGPLGVLTFVYSVLMSRGLDVIRSDMDDPTSYLVGQFGHSSQELVNLMLVGRAVTNVFDGDKVLGDANDPTAFRLKGVAKQNEIGFMTLLEALRYCQVGEYYKSPSFPIWVVGSSNHYTVCFSLDRRVGRLTSAAKKQRLARSAFDTLDPEGNGFLPIASLPVLLEKLGGVAMLPAGTSMEEVKRRLDPDGLGLLLYERVLTVLDQWDKLKAMTAAQAAMPNTPYSCSACTFNNIATAQTCEICGTPRPPPVVAQQPPAEVEIENFVLYHFNGIEIPNKSLCECVRVSVSVVEGGLPPQIQGDVISEGQGLQEVLLTRWPSCILDFHGTAKIS